MKRINPYERFGLRCSKRQSMPHLIVFSLVMFVEGLPLSQRSLSLLEQYALYQEQQAIEPRNI